MRFTEKTIDELAIDDEESFEHVALYADLHEVLRRASHRFKIMPHAATPRWDRALLLNLTFWGGDGGDVLVDDHIAADVVAHVAWHRLAARAFATASAQERPSADALFFGEAVASAFDVYLVGRLLGHAPDSSFLETQVPAMADAADQAGTSETAFESLLESIAADPERAFEDLRALLFDASTALFACKDTDEGLVALARFDAHRFAPLLHRYELSNWVLYARAYADAAPDGRVRELDRALRAAPVSLDALASAWISRAC